MEVGVAVVVLVGLAAVAAARDAGAWPGIFLAAAVAVLVGHLAYSTGYIAARRDLHAPPHLRPLTEVQRTELLMRAMLPSWRRWLDWGALAVAGVLPFIVKLWVAPIYRGSGLVCAAGYRCVRW
jgi:hypothetical protein